MIEADRAVIGNLLKNAFKFTSPRTTITLHVGTSVARVVIEILDDCGGLPDGTVNERFGQFEELPADAAPDLWPRLRQKTLLSV